MNHSFYKSYARIITHELSSNGNIINTLQGRLPVCSRIVKAHAGPRFNACTCVVDHNGNGQLGCPRKETSDTTECCFGRPGWYDVLFPFFSSLLGSGKSTFGNYLTTFGQIQYFKTSASVSSCTKSVCFFTIAQAPY